MSRAATRPMHGDGRGFHGMQKGHGPCLDGRDLLVFHSQTGRGRPKNGRVQYTRERKTYVKISMYSIGV